jgi:hypothetical protein
MQAKTQLNFNPYHDAKCHELNTQDTTCLGVHVFTLSCIRVPTLHAITLLNVVLLEELGDRLQLNVRGTLVNGANPAQY